MACGRGDKGQLGRGYVTERELRPIIVIGSQIQRVICGEFQSIAVTTGRKVLTCGLNDNGQL